MCKPKEKKYNFFYKGLLNNLADFIIYNLVPNTKLR